VEKIALIGWSYEGGVAMRYTLRHPDRVNRVVLIGPISPRNTPYGAESRATLASRRDSAVVAELETLLEAVSAGGGPEQRRAYWHLFHKAFKFNPDVELRFRSDYYTLQNELPDYVFPVHIAAINSSLGDWDWRTELEGLEVPVLVIHGDHDFLPLAGAHEWVETLPNAQLRIVSQAGHFPWAENPEAVFPAIDLFLSGEGGEQ
jgi:proline iminopeptidase